MKRNILCIAFLLSSMYLAAFQNSALSLKTPTSLYEDEAEIALSHRFYGAVSEDILDTFFGMNAGANVGLAYRQNLIYNIELGASFERSKNRYELGSSFRFTPFEYQVQGQFDLRYFSFKQPGEEDRRKNFLYLFSAQNKPLFERLVFSMNAGFDGYYERAIGGIGLHIIAADKITLLGEYYPVLDRDSAADRLKQYLGKHDAYTFGIKIDTYGHHFIFSLGNADALNPSTLSMGTNNKDLRFGFNIHRRMQF